MDDYLVGVMSNIGVISFVALSAYLLLLTGEISFGQQAFFAIGAYAAGIATAMWGWTLAAALVRDRRVRPDFRRVFRDGDQRHAATLDKARPVTRLAAKSAMRALVELRERLRHQMAGIGAP